MDHRTTITGCRAPALERGRTGGRRREDPEHPVVVLDTEGALWITTSNRDGIGTPVEEDDRVLRILPPSAAGTSPL